MKCTHFPGTRQLAIKTNKSNGRCEKKWLTLARYVYGNSIRRKVFGFGQKERDELHEVGKTCSEHLARHEIKTSPKYLRTRRFMKCSPTPVTAPDTHFPGTRQLAIKTNKPNGRCEKKWLTLARCVYGNSIRREVVGFEQKE
ncbi:hypothetical protein CDAR_24521 [Caerostris darwini]|uniref:Uncharacterized protein n=1 Tax=Caerostris darwini TaxID=1538125 RepID=A0AAV4SBT9_9ARAC|nr:hypothetical protein CDAR_24521 [Caerostris darwini]